MENRSQLLRHITVALFPMRFGTGQSTKVMEAAEAGCTLLVTPEAIRGLDYLMPHAEIESDARRIADAAIALRSDVERARRLATSARAAVEAHYNRDTTLRRLRAIATGETIGT